MLGNYTEVHQLSSFLNENHEWMATPAEILEYRKNPSMKEWEVLISWKDLLPHEATWEGSWREEGGIILDVKRLQIPWEKGKAESVIRFLIVLIFCIVLSLICIFFQELIPSILSCNFWSLYQYIWTHLLVFYHIHCSTLFLFRFYSTCGLYSGKTALCLWALFFLVGNDESAKGVST